MRSALKLLVLSFLLCAVAGNLLGSPRRSRRGRKPIASTVVDHARKQADAKETPSVGTNALPSGAATPGELILAPGSNAPVDLRDLPEIPPERQELPEREPPELQPRLLQPPGAPPPPLAPLIPRSEAAAPVPLASFDGLDFQNWGTGHPPDTNGDVGPTYFIQTINSSIGIYRKSDGVR